MAAICRDGSGGGLAQKLHVYCFERHYEDKSDRMLR